MQIGITLLTLAVMPAILLMKMTMETRCSSLMRLGVTLVSCSGLMKWIQIFGTIMIRKMTRGPLIGTMLLKFAMRQIPGSLFLGMRTLTAVVTMIGLILASQFNTTSRQRVKTGLSLQALSKSGMVLLKFVMNIGMQYPRKSTHLQGKVITKC